LYFFPANLLADKQKSVLDPSFTLRTTRNTSDWADTYAFCKAKPSIMSEKMGLRNKLEKYFAVTASGAPPIAIGQSFEGRQSRVNPQLLIQDAGNPWGQRFGQCRIQKKAPGAAGQHILHAAGVFMAGGKPHHGLGQTWGQFNICTRQRAEPALLRSVQMQAGWLI
jgi:hypothetical protein